MPSRLRNLLFATAILVSAAHLRGQEDFIANSSPPLPADPNLAKIACFRVLYAADVKAPAITLAKAADASHADLLASKVAGGTFSPYIAVRPEKYTLYVLDGNVTGDLTKDVLEKSKVAEPVKIELPAGGYRTILIQNQAGKTSASLLSDTATAASAPPEMRVLDLSGLSGWAVQLLNPKGNPISTLWKTGSPSEHIQIPNSGIYLIRVVRNDKTHLRQIATFECRIVPGNAFSIILLPGYKNRGSALFTFDGTLGSAYNVDTIKTLASGVAPPSQP